jgi:hypothetical protein
MGCSLTCKDVQASIRWYRDVLGFAVAQTFERDGKVAGAAIVAGDVPPFITLVPGPMFTVTTPRAKCAPSSLRITLPPRTVSTSPARESTSPITVSMPAPGTLVPAYTEVASYSRVAGISVPSAAVSVPGPAVASASRPALPV